MEKSAFVIFFTVFLAAYSVINLYIFVKGWQALEHFGVMRVIYAACFFILYASFIAGRVLERVQSNWFSAMLVWAGSFWLAAMVYFFLAVLLIDLCRLVNYGVPFYPSVLLRNYEGVKIALMSGVIIIVTGAIAFGYFNAVAPQVKNLEIHIPKRVAGFSELNIAVASDIHLGTIISKARLEHIIDKINALNPDLVLLPGDVIDEDLGPVIDQNLGETIRKIRSKYGVYAITGNHEYIGGVEPACKYLSEHGITMLRDKTVLVESSFYLVGREDISSRGFAGFKRKQLKELVSEVDFSRPVILMDHQPFKLNEATENNIDVQLSGHTHHGQMWPFNYITGAIYELSWGYLRKGNTQFYVSCGAGTWGPPVRIGNSPEIISLRLMFGG